MSQILKYVGYTKPTLAIYVLHKLHGQMSQDHDFFFSLNADRDEASLISVGTKFHNWGSRTFTEFFLYFELAEEIDRFQTCKSLPWKNWYFADE